MLYFLSLQINKDITFKNTMIENHINLKMSGTNLHDILSAYKCETASKFKKEMLHIVFQRSFQFALFVVRMFGESCKFQDIGIANDVLCS